MKVTYSNEALSFPLCLVFVWSDHHKPRRADCQALDSDPEAGIVDEVSRLVSRSAISIKRPY